VEEALRQRGHRQSGGQSRGQKHGGYTGSHSNARGGTADDEHVHERGQTLADDGSAMEEVDEYGLGWFRHWVRFACGSSGGMWSAYSGYGLRGAWEIPSYTYFS